jgi:hypothetical protein
MFQVQNKTPFVARLFPAADPDGGEVVVALVKGTFTLREDGKVALADEQVPPVMADQYYAEPDKSSLRYANDLAPEKKGTDVVMIGAAHAPKPDATEVDVSLEVGTLRKTVRVFGDRTWKRVLGLASYSTNPAPLAKLPLTYERAFGGADKTHPDEKQWKFEPRNPVGKGFIANRSRPDFTAVGLPNIENPEALLTWYQDTPAPAGFGFIAPGWEPRKRFAGTFDQAWQDTRCPLLPADFDPRFYNAAHPDLISKEYLRGGESVRITNASKNGTLAFALPKREVTAEFFIDGQATTKPCDLDTVVIEPDEKRLLLTWRAKVRCHRKMKFVTGARVVAVER